MSENTFNPQELNLQLQPLPTYIDLDGSFRLNTPMLSSFDFNGLIPKFDGLISVSSVKPGYLIQVASGQYFPVVSVEYDEDDLEDVPSGIVTINYIDDQGNTSPIDYNQTSSVYVIYENWNEKILGTNGWGITSGGNAIFSNVAVRGNIEATSGKVEDLIIGQDYYPIGTIHGVENPSSSVTGDPGQIIMYVGRSDISPSNSRIKKLYKNDIVELSGVSASGWVMGFGYVEPASAFFEVFSRIKVLSASYNHPIGPSYFGDKYHCQIVQDSSIIYDWNLGSLSASSGSFTFGPMNMGSFWAFSETSSDVIEGFVFNQIGEGNNWDNYIPDYLDVSGRFRLGGGKLIFDGTTLSIDANVAVGNLSASYTSYDFLSASYANLNKLATSGQTIINGGNITTGNIKSIGYSGPGTGSAFSTIGMLINLNDGSIASKQFRIDSSGNATFSGDLSAAGGTFSGNLSAAGGTFAGTVSANNVTAGTLTGSTFRSSTGINASSGNGIYLDSSGNVRFANTLSSLQFNSGGLNVSGAAITGSTFQSAGGLNRIEISGGNLINFYNNNLLQASLDSTSFTFLGVTTNVLSVNNAGFYVNGTLSVIQNASFNTSLNVNQGITCNSITALRTGAAGFTGRGDGLTNIPGGSIVGNISGNANNITAYNINQNLGTSANVTFNGGLNSTGVYSNAITGTGRRNMVVGSSGSIGQDTSSTFKLKHDIQSITSDSIKINIPEEKISSSSDVIVDYTDVLKLTPVSFKWDVDNSSEVGLIAEEVKEILPIAYQEGEIPSYDRNMVMIMTLAVVKEQQKIIENLQNRMLQLESQLGENNGV